MLMKQSSLDEPELVIEYDGARGSPGLGGGEGDREMNDYDEQRGFEDQFQYSAPQHNQSESRSTTPESTKAKGRINVIGSNKTEVISEITSVLTILYRFYFVP